MAHTFQNPDLVKSGFSRLPVDCLIAGNGDIGVNVRWLETGRIEMLLSKTDAWDEISRLVKVAKIEIDLGISLSGWKIEQKAFLTEAVLVLRATKELHWIEARIWIDAMASRGWVEIKSDLHHAAQVSLIPMRAEALSSDRVSSYSAKGMSGSPESVMISADQIYREKERIGVYHRNEASIYALQLKHQGLEEIVKKTQDPLKGRSFGVMISAGDGRISEGVVIKNPALTSTIQFSVHAGIFPQCEEWLKSFIAHHEVMRTESVEEAFPKHLTWWSQFWQRSQITITNPPTGGGFAGVVSRAYRFQRYMTACAGRGDYPIKFNGSIFNTEMNYFQEQFAPDDRLWGGGYWFQNTRFSYWTMLQTGDYEMMKSFFTLYFNALEFGEQRNQIWRDKEGGIFPETMYFWGSHLAGDYGWNRSGKEVGEVQNGYIRRHWNGSIELFVVALEYWRHIQDDCFFKDRILPGLKRLIYFYQGYYPLGLDQKRRFEPSQALEVYQDTVNPMPDIAGLTYLCREYQIILKERVDFKESLFVKELQEFEASLPSIPLREIEPGVKVLAFAEEIRGCHFNMENANLYAIFPYPLYGIGKPDLELARRSFFRRYWHQTGCWFYDGIHAAELGLMESARSMVFQNADHSNPQSSWPAFWISGFDWAPDQDHGSVMMLILQKMLLKTEDKKIFLFPAWPWDWNVQFKLHAPHQTTIEGEWKEGVLIRLEVNPVERRNDLVVLTPQKDG